MAVEDDVDSVEKDDYDEEADSDFDEDENNEDAISSSSDEEATSTAHRKNLKSTKQNGNRTQEDVPVELDSGDEATIKEQRRAKRHQKKSGEDAEHDSEEGPEGWKAKTRAMREREKVEKKRNKLATSKGSTIDVDKIWEVMNRPGPLPPVRIEGEEAAQGPDRSKSAEDENKMESDDKENIPNVEAEEMITIKRRFKFAGEVHVEEKVVPKSSAEARLWLNQQENRPQISTDQEMAVQRPLRKISRFDPNYNNLAAFKTNWVKDGLRADTFKGPKLNVVEKSKMDWAVHVDAAGLEEELRAHAKAKEGYHGRMDFLNQVEQRKEEESRQARIKK